MRNPHGHVILHLSLQGTEGYKSIGSSTQHSACSLESAPTCPLKPGRPASQASQAALGAKGPAGDAGGGRGGGLGDGDQRELNSCASRHHHKRSAGPSSLAFSSPLLIPSRMFFAHRVRCEEHQDLSLSLTVSRGYR